MTKIEVLCFNALRATDTLLAHTTTAKRFFAQLDCPTGKNDPPESNSHSPAPQSTRRVETYPPQLRKAEAVQKRSGTPRLSGKPSLWHVYAQTPFGARSSTTVLL